MDLRSIGYFVRIADAGSVRLAADQLRIAQSALSRQVRLLETEIGMPLLVRHARGVRLTAAGVQFLDHCQRVTREITLLKEEMRVRKDVPRGSVVLGIPPTLGPLLLPGSIERARKQCPDVVLRVIEGYSTVLFDALLAGQIDVAILMNPPASRALTLRPLVAEPIVLLRPRSRDNERPGFVTMEELAAMPLIVTAAMRAIIEDRLRRINLKPNIQIEVSAIEAIRRVLLRGTGVTALPVSVFHDDIRAGRIVACPIADGDFHRMLYLAYPTRYRHTAAVEEISQILAAETNALADIGAFTLAAGASGAQSGGPGKPSKPRSVRKTGR
jgi:LysR family nitrogen assimilation transcriptional regulator